MSLEYLVGRPVEAISVPLKDREWKWAMILEGGVRIQYHGDLSKPEPEALYKGSVLGVVEINEGSATVHFYKTMAQDEPPEDVAQLELQEGDYVIAWPKGSKPPHVERDPEADLPPDPSSERVAEGPVDE